MGRTLDLKALATVRPWSTPSELEHVHVGAPAGDSSSSQETLRPPWLLMALLWSTPREREDPEKIFFEQWQLCLLMETFHSTWLDRGRIPQSSALPFTTFWGVETRLRNPATPSCGLSQTERTPSKMMYSFLLCCRERKHSHEIILFALVGTEIMLLLRNAPLCCLSSTAMSQSQCPTLQFFSNRNLTPEALYFAVFQQQKSCTRNSLLCCLLATEIWHHKQSTLLSFSNRNTPLHCLLAT